jgi:hypothetical protein
VVAQRRSRGPRRARFSRGGVGRGDTLYFSSAQPQTSVVCWKIFLSLRVFRSNR